MGAIVQKPRIGLTGLSPMMSYYYEAIDFNKTRLVFKKKSTHFIVMTK